MYCGVARGETRPLVLNHQPLGDWTSRSGSSATENQPFRCMKALIFSQITRGCSPSSRCVSCVDVVASRDTEQQHQQRLAPPPFSEHEAAPWISCVYVLACGGGKAAHFQGCLLGPSSASWLSRDRRTLKVLLIRFLLQLVRSCAQRGCTQVVFGTKVRNIWNIKSSASLLQRPRRQKTTSVHLRPELLESQLPWWECRWWECRWWECLWERRNTWREATQRHRGKTPNTLAIVMKCSEINVTYFTFFFITKIHTYGNENFVMS